MVDDLWPTVKSRILDGCMGNPATAIADYSDCRSGNAFLLVAGDLADKGAVCVVRFSADSGQLVATIGAMSGRGMDWNALLAQVREWCGSLGAEFVKFEGRKGWQKALPGCDVVSVNYRIRCDAGFTGKK